MLPTTDEDIIWLCEECSQLFSTKPLPPSQRQSYCNISSFEKNMSSEAAEDVVDGEQFVRKKRRWLILEDSSDEKMESVPSDNDCKDEGATKISGDSIYVYSSPIFNPVWGYFDINGRCYGRVAAHLSNKASSKVFEGANMLDSRLHLQKLPRSEAWPTSFSLSPPTDDNIALYFFPESQRDDVVIDELLDEVNHLDLVLTAELDRAELLLSSSLLLPKNYWRFRGKCYIWGVFRGEATF
ncbi:PHD finger-containing protein 1-like [Aristolochia californica]|uniref:PHD finger-containing protein 1-like n=1 Tax=Aristolochia californica TaxID=171875 RepID=UPI0035E11CCA